MTVLLVLSATVLTARMLTVVPEIAIDFGTTAAVVTIRNALYLLITGPFYSSLCIWSKKGRCTRQDQLPCQRVCSVILCSALVSYTS